MKATGIVRKIDELGRIVLPIELRRTLHVKDKDSLEVFVQDDMIILEKYEPNNACIATGIVRKIDELGRFVLPIELRRTLNVHDKDALEVFVQGDCIILKKYQPSNACLLTGEISASNLHLFNGKLTLSEKAAIELHKELEIMLTKSFSYS